MSQTIFDIEVLDVFATCRMYRQNWAREKRHMIPLVEDVAVAQPKQQIKELHPSADRSCRFELDNLLRNYGYRIASRRLGREPLWERRGRRFLQRDIIKTLDGDAVDTACYLMDLYYANLPGDPQ